MSDIKLLILFKNQLINLCEEIINQFPDEGDFVIFKIFITNNIPIERVIVNFLKFINKNNGEIRRMITSRKDDFFINENPFNFLGSDKVSRLSYLWTSGRMDDDDKIVLWKWIDSLIIIGDKYNDVAKNKLV